MLKNRNLVEKVAEAVYRTTYKGAFDEARPSAKAEARTEARTIISAFACRQPKTDAAKRLATWHWVDLKKPHVAWEDAPEQLRLRFLKKASAGYDALRAV